MTANLTQATDIHGWIDELTRPRTHREPLTIRRGHTTYTGHHIALVPSLIEQLATTERPSTGSAGSGAYGSRPTGNIEAVDTLVHIDNEAAQWVRTLGDDDPGNDLDRRHLDLCLPVTGSGTIACIRRLHALHAGITDDRTRRELERAVRSWWTQARIITGWESPAWRPDNTCPACGNRGSLRVRLASSSGLCIECRATWDRDTIGLLAEHIRSENAEDDDTEDDTLAEGA